ncbi:MAG: hypothetical protein K2Y14_09900 [Burkholderiales bacterium]|nr:hypothetical protein [Burkholderiales bacterium]
MQIYRVGGYVRDKLLGIKPDDCDYVVIGSTPEQMLQQGYHQVGKFFPVFLHPQTREEYALARTEYKQGTGHTGFQVNSSPDVSLEQDLFRRDLTINAIAEDQDGNIIDPYHGQADLKQKTLRHVSTAFADDPLRVLRVARFAAKLNFSVADKTLFLMQQMALSGEGLSLSRERVLNELNKALECKYSYNFFSVLRKTQNLGIFFPTLALQLKDTKNFTKFIHDLQISTNQLQRYQLIALYLSTTFAEKNLTEISHDKKLLKMLYQTQLIRQLSENPQLSPENQLNYFKQLDIWRNYAQFAELCANYAEHLSACQQTSRLKRLEGLIKLAQELKNAPLQKIVSQHSEQPAKLAQTIKQLYLDLISQTKDLA